jgi:uncharacterized protein YaiI (UPF0178 family)
VRIWVDADACPAVIKEILYRAAERRQSSSSSTRSTASSSSALLKLVARFVEA